MSPEDSAALTNTAKRQVEELFSRYGVEIHDTVSEWAGYLEFHISVPVQKNFCFEVSISLQNHDEIHINVKHYTASYFPVNKQLEMQQALDDIEGLINGSRRIVCYYYNNGAFCDSTMQNFENGSWDSTRGYGRGCNPFWFLTLRPKSTPQNTAIFWNKP